MCVSVYAVTLAYTRHRKDFAADTSRAPNGRTDGRLDKLFKATRVDCGSCVGRKNPWVDNMRVSGIKTNHSHVRVVMCLCVCVHFFFSCLYIICAGRPEGQQTLWKVNSVHYCCIKPFITWEGTHTGVIGLFIWLTCIVSHPTYTNTFTHTQRNTKEIILFFFFLCCSWRAEVKLSFLGSVPDVKCLKCGNVTAY